MRVHESEITLVTTQSVWDFWSSNCSGSVVVDYETNGKPIWEEEFRVIGIGLAFYALGELRGFYVPVFESELVSQKPKSFRLVRSRAEKGLVRSVVNWLHGKELIAHNVMFDGSVCKKLEIPANFIHDTMVGLHLLLPGETYTAKKDQDGNYVFNEKTGKFQLERRSLSLKWAMRNILGWKESNEKEVTEFIRKNKHKKGQDLWICPLDLIWSYGALDAIATFRLYEQQIAELKRLYGNQNYTIMAFILGYVDLLSNQMLDGTNFDRSGALTYQKELVAQIETVKENFMELAKDKIEALELKNFNINSNAQLIKLFFSKKGFNKTPLSFTNKGDPALTKETLPGYGKPGSCLAVYKTKTKLLQFLESYLELSEKTGKLHVRSNVCGQLSGRVSQSDPNLTQMPRRDSKMVKLFKPEPGWGLIQADAVALEPTVLTVFSRDPVLRKIYANPDPEKNYDVYLELGLRMKFKLENGETCGDYVAKFYQSGQDSLRFGEAKKHLKLIRNKMKIVQLALGYAGTELALMESLKIPYDEAHQIYVDYWETFERVQIFDKFIQKKAAEGPIFTFHGRPINVARNKAKDSLNSLIQSSGHDILMHMNQEIFKLAKQRKVPMRPYIADIHDEFIHAVRLDYAEEAYQIVQDAAANVNSFLRNTGWWDFDVRFPLQQVNRRPNWVLQDLSEIEK